MTGGLACSTVRATIPAGRLDCVVVGGGVNGAGAFRDLAMRGLRVALFEKGDFGGGTSGASSGMIHGGLRYLLTEPGVTKLSCRDSGAIRRTASHLIFRIPFLLPVLESARLARGLLFGADAMLFGYDLYARLKGGVGHMLFGREELLRIEPDLSPGVIGGVSFDEWGIEVHRLCWLLARSGEEHGGKAHNHARVSGLRRVDPGGGAEPFFEVEVDRSPGGGRETVEARCVVNAAGPWGPLVAGLAGASYRLRPAKGVHLVLDRRISNYAIVASAVDGREVFLEPWENVTLVGTTDDDYYGDLDDVPVTFDEVRYLTESMASVFPAVREARVISTWAGIRPTLYEYGTSEDKLTREHAVHDHASQGLPGLWSVAGGKLASFRLMSEEAADAVCAFLGVERRSTTAEVPLPGSEEEIDVPSLGVHWSVEPAVLRRMCSRHGARVREILVGMLRVPGSRGAVCACEPVTGAEIAYSIAQEKVRTLDDLSRRTRFGTGPCGGGRCALRAAAILGRHLGWDGAAIREAAREFLDRQYRKRRAAIGGVQARQEVLTAMHLR